jgi:hypothetical protein
VLHRVRIALPDRPGSLAKVARVMAASGADVVRVDVLEREAGRAVDDFLLDLPTGRAPAMAKALHAEPGVDLLVLAPTGRPPGSHPEIDLFEHAIARPHRALTTLTDMAADVFAAEWAVLVSHGHGSARPLMHSADAPEVDLTELPLGRVSWSMGNTDSGQLAGGRVDANRALVVGRSAGVWYTLEVERLRRVVALIATIALEPAADRAAVS